MATKTARTTLTPREGLFVVEYLTDLDASNAARRCGYSTKTARQIGYVLLRKPHIAAAVKKAIADRKRKTLRTNETVLDSIERIGRAAEIAGEFNAAIKAQELLGKHQGMFVNRLEHTGRDGAPIATLTMTDLTDAELAAIAAGRRG